MKQDTKPNHPKGYIFVVLGSMFLLFAGCQSLPWNKSDPAATVQDTVTPVGEYPEGGDVPVVISSEFNADFDELQETTLAQDVFQSPSRPLLPPILEDSEPEPLEFIGLDTSQNFPQKNDDLDYIVQRGDTLWGISQKFKISLNKLMRANDMTKGSLLGIGQSLRIPGISESESPLPRLSFDLPSQPYSGAQDYVVKKGDTLTRVAYAYGTSVKDLKSANGLFTDRLLIGQRLVVPEGGAVREIRKPAATTVVPTTAGGGHHIVRRGEYPSSIARQYGMKTSDLIRLNNIQNPSALQIGTKLVVNTGSGNLPQSVGQFVKSPPPVSTPGPVPSSPSGLNLDSLGTVPVPGDTPSTDEVPLFDEDALIVPVEDVE